MKFLVCCLIVISWFVYILRIRKDEHDVQSLIEAIVSMVNPFDSANTDLISLSSGALPTTEVKNDLLSAHSVGEKNLQGFMQERIVNQSLDFFSPLKNVKLKTFASVQRKQLKKAELQSVRSDRSLFIQLLLVAKEREIDMREILCYTLSPVPGCFSTIDQTSISKTNKSKLLQHLESLVPQSLVTKKPQGCAVVIDAMALIQSLSSAQLPDKFGDLAEVIFKRMLQIAGQYGASRVDCVGDRYDAVSIKCLERARRNQSRTSQSYVITRAEQKLPVQWAVFLKSGENKQSLQTFLTKQFQTCLSPTSITVTTALESEADTLYYTPGQPTTVTRAPLLNSDHEEADTRLLLHAKDCSRSFKTVVVWSPDTDVAVIGIGLAESLTCDLLFATGTRNSKRLISLTEIALSIKPVAEVLPAFHALTGCDTTSSFYGKGKKTAYNIVTGKTAHVDSLRAVGDDFAIDKLPSGIEELVCELYGAKASTINEARFQIFKNGGSEKLLPPTNDALLQHVKRAKYQTKIWRSALKSKMACPGPDANGWCVEDDKISIHWLTKDYAPKSILKTTKCGCKAKGCNSGQCACFKTGLRCTVLCSCKGCTNANPADSSTLDNSDEDSECIDSDEN